MSSAKIQYSFSQACDGCRECCWNEKDTLIVLFTSQEVGAIQAARPADLPLFLPYRGSGRVFTVKTLSATMINRRLHVCPFYEMSTHRCRIYARRPFDCRIWPFFFAHGKDPREVWLCYYHHSCPAVDDLQAFDAHTIARFVNPRALALLKRYPELIWEYAAQSSFRQIQRIDPLLES